MKCAIIGNGDFIPCATVLQRYDAIIAADGGSHHCRRLGIIPSLIVGDFDSAQPVATAGEQIVRQTDQMTTDLQKALQQAELLTNQPTDSIDAFCVTSGGRLDHTLTAIWLLTQHDHLSTVYTPTQAVRHLTDHCELPLPIGTHLSLLPVGAEAIISITGCAWNGQMIALNKQRSGVSNYTTAETVTITIQRGSVWCINAMTWN